MKLRIWSGTTGILHELFLQRVVNRQVPLQKLAGPANGRAHLLQLAIRDLGDLLQREALNGVKQESFALLAPSRAQGHLDQAEQLAPCREILGRIGGGIGHHTFLHNVPLPTALIAQRVDRLPSQPVQPGLHFDALRLVVLLTQSAGDRLVHYVIHGKNLAGAELSLTFAKIEFALDEAPEPGQVNVNVTRNVAGGNRLRLDHGNRVLEGDRLNRRSAFRATPAWPLVVVAQQLLMLLELFGSSVKRGFDGSGRGRTAFLRRHLTRWEPQVQRHDNALTRRALLDNAFKVHKFRTEYPKVSPQLFHLLIDYFFEIGSFGNLVADMNVHIKASPDGEFHPQLCSSRHNLTPLVKKQAGKNRPRSAFRNPALSRPQDLVP